MKKDNSLIKAYIQSIIYILNDERKRNEVPVFNQIDESRYECMPIKTFPVENSLGEFLVLFMRRSEKINEKWSFSIGIYCVDLKRSNSFNKDQIIFKDTVGSDRQIYPIMGTNTYNKLRKEKEQLL